MEATTATPSRTGSRTIADLLPRAAEQFGEHVAVKHKDADGGWRELTFAEVGEIAREIGLGLLDLGIAAGDRVSILCTTRPDWTYASFGITEAGAVVVPIYPTNSPEECEWVLADSEAVAVVCEDACQVEKVRAVADRLPHLREIISIEPVEGTVSVDALRARGRARDAAELQARIDAVKAEEPYTIIYTSGTTGPPKGCILGPWQLPRDHRHGQRSASCSSGADDLVYLYLPLAHSFALLIELASVRPRHGDRLLRRRRQADRRRAGRGEADLPAVGPAHLREDLRPGRRQRRRRHAGQGDRGGRPGAGPARGRRRRSRRSCRPPTTSSTRRCSPTCARRSAAGCARRSPAPRRSPRRSSSSSGPAACR